MKLLVKLALCPEFIAHLTRYLLQASYSLKRIKQVCECNPSNVPILQTVYVVQYTNNSTQTALLAALSGDIAMPTGSKVNSSDSLPSVQRPSQKVLTSIFSLAASNLCVVMPPGQLFLHRLRTF